MSWTGEFDVFDGEFQLERSGAAAAAASDEWVRNKAWPTLVEPTAGEQKVVGLYAVYSGEPNGLSNFFACTCRGAYTVDPGDGSAPTDVADNTKFEHEYDFDDGDLYDATVTLTDAGDLVTRTNHGYTNGDRIQLHRIASTTGVSEGQSYYVINATANTFQLSLTEGGSAVTLTTNGTASLLPYKIATVTITPQAGQNLTLLQLSQLHSAAATTYSAPWLDLAIAAASCTTLDIRFPRTPRMLERLVIVEVAETSFSQLCDGFTSLQSVSIGTTGTLTNTATMFRSCLALKHAPMFNTASVTNMSSMFQLCSALESVPLYDTSSVTSMLTMFNGCSSLKVVPLFNTSLVTNMSGLFNDCRTLSNIPAFNTANVTNFSNFAVNAGLTSLPALDCAAGTNFNAAFANGGLMASKVTGVSISHSYATSNLSAAALNEIYTNLPSVTPGSQTITVTGNYGTSGDDPTIATAKGWTVTG